MDDEIVKNSFMCKLLTFLTNFASSAIAQINYVMYKG